MMRKNVDLISFLWAICGAAFALFAFACESSDGSGDSGGSTPDSGDSGSDSTGSDSNPAEGGEQSVACDPDDGSLTLVIDGRSAYCSIMSEQLDLDQERGRKLKIVFKPGSYELNLDGQKHTTAFLDHILWGMPPLETDLSSAEVEYQHKPGFSPRVDYSATIPGQGKAVFVKGSIFYQYQEPIYGNTIKVCPVVINRDTEFKALFSAGVTDDQPAAFDPESDIAATYCLIATDADSKRTKTFDVADAGDLFEIQWTGEISTGASSASTRPALTQRIDVSLGDATQVLTDHFDYVFWAEHHLGRPEWEVFLKPPHGDTASVQFVYSSENQGFKAIYLNSQRQVLAEYAAVATPAD